MDRIARTREVFDSWDTNGDGVLDFKEIMSGCLASGMEPDDVADLFQRLDVNADGTVTLDEWLAGAGGLGGDRNTTAGLRAAARAYSLFNFFDQDRDGLVTREEAMRAIAALRAIQGVSGDHARVNDEQAAAYAALGDRVTADEFSEFYSRNPISVAPTVTLQNADIALATDPSLADAVKHLTLRNVETGETQSFNVVVRPRDVAEVPEAVSYQWLGPKTEWSCDGKKGTVQASAIAAVAFCVNRGREFWLDGICIPLSGVDFPVHAVHMGELYLNARVIPCQMWGGDEAHLRRGWVQQEVLIPPFVDDAFSPEILATGAEELIAGYEAVSDNNRLLGKGARDFLVERIIDAGLAAAESEDAVGRAAIAAIESLASTSGDAACGDGEDGDRGLLWGSLTTLTGPRGILDGFEPNQGFAVDIKTKGTPREVLYDAFVGSEPPSERDLEDFLGVETDERRCPLMREGRGAMIRVATTTRGRTRRLVCIALLYGLLRHARWRGETGAGTSFKAARMCLDVFHASETLAARCVVSNLVLYGAGNHTYRFHVTGVAGAIMNRSYLTNSGSQTSLQPCTFMLEHFAEAVKDAKRRAIPTPRLLRRLEDEYMRAPFTVEFDRTIAIFGTWNALTGENRGLPNQDGGETNDSNFEKVAAQGRGTAGMSTPQTFVRNACGGAAQFFMRVVPREKGVGEDKSSPFECQTSFVAVKGLADRKEGGGGVTASWMSVNKNVFPVVVNAHAPSGNINRFVARGNQQTTASHICGANFNYALPMSAKRAAESRGKATRDTHFRQFFKDVIDAALDSGELDAEWRPMLHDDGDGTVIVH